MSEERSLKIQVNKNTIDRFKQSNIQMDLMGTVHVVLSSLFEDRIDLLDHADDANKQRRMIVLYRQLEHRGLIERDVANKALYRLTPKGSELITYLKEQYDEEFISELDDVTENAEPITAEDPVGGWIGEWMAIFPDNNGDGRPLRTHPLNLTTKMKKFMDKYNFDKDTILKATKEYINSQARSVDGHKYTRTAHYFIAKGIGGTSTSDLADWCQRVKSGDFDEEKPDTRMMDMV